MPEDARVFSFKNPEISSRPVFVEVAPNGVNIGYGSGTKRNAVGFRFDEARLLLSAIREAVDFAEGRGLL